VPRSREAGRLAFRKWPWEKRMQGVLTQSAQHTAPADYEHQRVGINRDVPRTEHATQPFRASFVSLTPPNGVR